MRFFSHLSTNSSTKSGFSLIELLVVIAIIWIISVSVSQIDFNGMGARQKRDRFANAIVTLFRNDITMNSTGKAISSWTSFIYPTKTLVIVDNTTIRTEYYSGSTLVNTHVFASQPFFGDSKYLLKLGTGNSSGWEVTFDFTGNDTLVMELQNGKTPLLYYSGATRTDFISAKIKLWYSTELIDIDIDTRNNLVQIEK